MPIVSGGGGGGGPAAGKYQPVGSQSGVTLDTTTYNDTVRGSGKLATLVFATEGAAFAIAQAGDAFPRYVFTSDPTDGLYLGDGTYDPYGGAAPYLAVLGHELEVGTGSGSVFTNGPPTKVSSLVRVDSVSPRFGIVAGALPTVALSSGTGAQISTARDAETVTPVTFNPGAATIATCTVALSPDNVTYSTLGIETEPAGVAFDGTIHLVKVRVPAAWYLKLTVNAQAVLGTTTWY